MKLEQMPEYFRKIADEITSDPGVYRMNESQTDPLFVQVRIQLEKGENRYTIFELELDVNPLTNKEDLF